MKLVSFISCSLALFAITLLLDTSQPLVAQESGQSALAGKTGQMCTISFRAEDSQSAMALGTLSQINSDWIVLGQAKRIEHTPDGPFTKEIWIPRKSITSISFE